MLRFEAKYIGIYIPQTVSTLFKRPIITDKDKQIPQTCSDKVLTVYKYKIISHTSITLLKTLNKMLCEAQLRKPHSSFALLIITSACVRF